MCDMLFLYRERGSDLQKIETYVLNLYHFSALLGWCCFSIYLGLLWFAVRVCVWVRAPDMSHFLVQLQHMRWRRCNPTVLLQLHVHKNLVFSVSMAGCDMFFFVGFHRNIIYQMAFLLRCWVTVGNTGNNKISEKQQNTINPDFQ